MSQNNQSRVKVVRKDGSGVFDKIAKLKTNGYFKRTRWERSTHVDVLDRDEDYLDFILHDKQYCGFERDNSRFGHTVESTLYTDPERNELLFATVANRNEITSSLTANQQYINGSSASENFMFASVFLNQNTSPATGQGNTPIQVLESVQLFRYDPVGKDSHPNKDEIYNAYETEHGKEVADLYRHFFVKSVGFPHFHFLNRTMSECYGKTAESDAISLDKLIKYIEKLMFETDKGNPINKFDFGMPYLKIKNNPNSYKTAIDFNKLQEALINNNVNIQLGNIFKQTQKLQPELSILTGLEAVYSDLVLLRILRGDDGPGLRDPGSQTPSGGGGPSVYPGGGAGGPASSGGGGNTSGGSSGGGSFNFTRIPNQGMNTDKFETRRRESREQPRYEISTAELQLACKISSGGVLKMKNSNGRDKMHYEEANAYVDERSYRMLCNVAYLCENQKNKGDDNGPAL